MQTHGWMWTTEQAPTEHKSLPSTAPTDRQPSRKAPKPPKPRKVERRRRGRKG